MKKISLYIIVGAILTFSGCKRKSKTSDDDTGFFPVISFLKSQVAHVDTSLYRIIRIDEIDSLQDTTYIKRDEFRGLTKDFLETPDITDKSLKKKYTEYKTYDESMDRVILTYTPKDDNMEVLREEVIISPNTSEGDQVKSIIIERMTEGKDSSILRRLLWQVNKSFQVVKFIQKPNQPETTRTFEVIWNKDSE
jgi:hypothetical protein